MNVEEMAVNSNELDEEVIPNSSNTPDDNELDDVIPCELVDFGEQDLAAIGSAPVYSNMDNLYNDNFSVTPSIPVSEMVDIAPHTVDTGNELEEDFIPESSNVLDENVLDDVVMSPNMV